MTAQTVTTGPVPPQAPSGQDPAAQDAATHSPTEQGPGEQGPGEQGPGEQGPGEQFPAAEAQGPARHPGPSLSPSRAADFKTCPLLFRFRTVDRLPEKPSPDQVRGTLVHAVLERLFDLPAAERTPQAAAELVEPQWLRLVEQEPALVALFDTTDDTLPGTHPASPPSAGQPSAAPPSAGSAAVDGTGTGPIEDAPDTVAELAAFLTGARGLLDGYFAVEDPRRLEPAERETLISTLVDDELLIRGYIDRLDVSPAGDLRVVDYKTGGAPREAFEARALFQLKFYALVLWRTRGVVPKVLRLLYLKDAEVIDYAPDEQELERFERTLVALSQAIEKAKRDKDFRAKPSRLCGWCSHQQFCPEFGGTPPPYPEPVAVTIDTGEPAVLVPGTAGNVG
jgi:putative RecB family exonuclease